MRVKLIFILVIAMIISCRQQDELIPRNHIQVRIDGTKYIFTGRSIVDPLDVNSRDTLYQTTYLGGYIGNCNEALQFVDIRINQNSIGNYSLSDGIEFIMVTEDHGFSARTGSEGSQINLTINEYGEEVGRISGFFSGYETMNNNLIEIEGSFSLERLPNNSNRAEVVLELCE